MDSKKVNRSQFYARLSMYITGSLFLGALMLLFLHSFSPFIESYGWGSWVALFATALVWLNFTMLAVRRFVSKAVGYGVWPWMLALLIFVPSPALMMITDRVLSAESQPLFLIFSGLGTVIGARLGIMWGDKRREEYLKHQKPNVSEDLKRGHEKVSLN